MDITILQEKWQEILNRVKEEHELSEVSYSTWLVPLKVHSVNDNIVTILVPQEQVGLNYISKKYTLPLQVAIAEVTGFECRVAFVTPESIKNSYPVKKIMKTRSLSFRLLI